MHWMPDMAFREDETRIFKSNGALGFNVLRIRALKLFNQGDKVRKKQIETLCGDYRSVLPVSLFKML